MLRQMDLPGSRFHGRFVNVGNAGRRPGFRRVRAAGVSSYAPRTGNKGQGRSGMICDLKDAICRARLEPEE